ncbi:unnamed protein product [Adineta steineri]|uniref:FAD dependent oxidoreductase domain-containing protein n=1 Tax=Adineta steineri TaxID=433720 RepID=A0A815Z5Y4_9BILA|nr:unnamed protein product [Adineta steineri]
MKEFNSLICSSVKPRGRQRVIFGEFKSRYVDRSSAMNSIHNKRLSQSNSFSSPLEYIVIFKEIGYWILSNTIKRFPILAESECETLIIGADSFTLDGRLIMNEMTEIDNYFIAFGSNGHGIALAGRVADYIAELIHNRNTNFRRQYSLKHPAYGEVLGSERPLCFKPDGGGKKDFEDLTKQGTFGKAR